MDFVRLFWEFFKAGAFSFGGGMATLPYMYEIANSTNWISEAEVTNILSVSQVTPGPLACNMGTVAGLHVGGVVGAFVANIAYVLPSIIFACIIYKFLKMFNENSAAQETISTVRAATIAIIISSSVVLFKMTFIIEGSLWRD